MERPTILICGARSGRYPLEAREREPDLLLTVHAYDCHQARKIREDLNAAGAHDVEVICAAQLPNTRTWDRALFIRDHKLMSAEFQLDCLQDLLAHIPGGEKACVAGVDKSEIRRVLSRQRDFSATWEASVPGGAKRTFTTFPGCFCHRRPDTGGLALAEVAAKLLINSSTLPPNSPRLLDMGCGCGFVGLLVADALITHGIMPQLTAIDSHTRAIEATKLNAKNLGINLCAILADDGSPIAENGSYDVFLGNPPYYGDWKIADLFLATAARALKPGGICLTVAKDHKGLGAVQAKHFARTEILSRRGYAILKSIR